MKRLLVLVFFAQMLCASTSTFYTVDNMDMQQCKLYNLPWPADPTEAATKMYVDTTRSNINVTKVDRGGDTMYGSLFITNAISSSSIAPSTFEATTKDAYSYVRIFSGTNIYTLGEVSMMANWSNRYRGFMVSGYPLITPTIMFGQYNGTSGVWSAYLSSTFRLTNIMFSAPANANHAATKSYVDSFTNVVVNGGTIPAGNQFGQIAFSNGAGNVNYIYYWNGSKWVGPGSPP